MKNLRLPVILICIISTSFFTSCTPENLDYVSTTKEVISQGKWSIDYYYAGQDKTAQYSNYQFSFMGNGTVMATNGTHTLSGSWNMITDVNRNEVLRISLTDQLQELNAQWNVAGRTYDVVSMKVNSNELKIRKL